MHQRGGEIGGKARIYEGRFSSVEGEIGRKARTYSIDIVGIKHLMRRVIE
ncbi:hypothetical protein KSZ_38880 [Dictyobacter formicarum]|uniref:Uncharacterized protein n=1 Tax=Dictyobacter formicarum TaxID=2778368 RepID=A0ABQ3VJ03_9CHLR|nr:hypothetical protein KSZ_38880 [Dictyobacter formicarum]